MKPLRADAIERARAVPLAERARRALETMREGIALKRIALRTRYPDLSEREIDEELRRWLRRDV